MHLLIFAAFDEILYDKYDLRDQLELLKKKRSSSRGCTCVCVSTCSRAKVARSCSSNSCWVCDVVCHYDGPSGDYGSGEIGGSTDGGGTVDGGDNDNGGSSGGSGSDGVSGYNSEKGEQI